MTLTPSRNLRYLSCSVAVSALMAFAPAALAQSAPSQATPAPAAQAQAPATQGNAIATQPAASAQSAPQPEQPPQTAAPSNADDIDEITTVTVAGQRPRNRIDREVYDPKDDPDTPISSAADALNKAPGVNVDPEGNITLRGKEGVQVLIDGKPSVMTQGEMRAATLQSMSADDIDSIEVITNPSAEFGAEGGSGIINLVMKRNRRPGKTLGINFGGGSDDSRNASLSAAYNSGRSTLSGGLNYREMNRESESNTIRERYNPNTDTTTRGESSSSGKNQMTNSGVSAGWDINVNDNDSIGVQAQFNKMDRDSRSMNTSTDFNAAGDPSNAFTSERVSSGERQNGSFRFNFNHKGDQDGETFKTDIRLSKSENTDDSMTTQLYSVGTRPDNRTQQQRYDENEAINISVDYKRRIGDGELAVGGEFDVGKNTYDNLYYDVDLANGDRTLNTIRSNRFILDQDETEAYVTYQVPVGTKWTVLGGLRVEHTEITINQVTTNLHRTNSYTKLHPSLHLSYYLTDNSKLRFSYSNRIRRPGANQLNPFIVYHNEENASSGNPDLKPQTTHSFEGGYEYNKDGRTFTLRGFYRKDEDTFVERSYYIDNNTVLLTTRENGGEGQSGGIEIALNGKVTDKLNIDLRGTLSYDELNTRRGGVDIKSDATSVNGRARLDYRLTPADRVQLMINAQGKQLTGQGYNDPVYTADLSYSHRFSNKLSMNLRVQDLFDSGERKRVIQTETLNQTSYSNWGGRTFYIGFSINPFARTAPTNSDDMGGGRMRGPGGGGFGGGPR
ncbi:TonB-dependent receptor domain-containing protein [Asticcacaulis tiandongensis]|uniref:TonB-dependent receptor domain-containing protein n=1 Tax=Asticcacaulis tiandongensis TaxID=2565365 RepID=UPI0015E851E0|nr:TonB-dependent receptor [Asticcacaulis tiandongensis]